jgi:hypothetical protein
MKHWIFQILVAIDQLFTALVGGWADETISSYAWRLEGQRKLFGLIVRPVIDAIFFWQKDGHCFSAYMAEVDRRQLPPILR